MSLLFIQGVDIESRFICNSLIFFSILLLTKSSSSVTPVSHHLFVSSNVSNTVNNTNDEREGEGGREREREGEREGERERERGRERKNKR